MSQLTEQQQAAREAVYQLLKFRPQSVGEVQQKLKRKGYDAQVIDETITWALSSGLLDDEKFAELWVYDRLVRRSMGAQRLKMELRFKGVSQDNIDHALSTVEADEQEMIRDLIEQRLPMYHGLEHEKRQRRMVSFLVNRGFSYGDIFSVLKTIKFDKDV